MITFGFEGAVTSVTDSSGYFQGGIVIGSPFDGTYTFDSSSSDQLSGDTTQGLYSTPDFSLTVQTGPLTLNAIGDDCSVYVVDGTAPGDIYGISGTTFESNGYYVSELILQLKDLSGQALANDHLLLNPPDLQQFDYRQFFLLVKPVGETQFSSIEGVITTITPEPASITLIAVGTLLLVRRRRHIVHTCHFGSLMLLLFCVLTARLYAEPFYGPGKSPPDPVTEIPFEPLSPPGSESVDIVFIIDGSGSISTNSFKLEKAGVKNCFYGPNATLS